MTVVNPVPIKELGNVTFVVQDWLRQLRTNVNSSGGTVTSVGLSVPSEFSVSGSPVTVTGSLTFAWTNPVSVPHGGSGAATFTAHGLLLGEGTGAFGVTAVGTNGQLLLGQTTADPTWHSMSGDATITNAGVITVAPASGVTAVITTAKLTAGGANGSMTFTNGILTAHTDAT